ncbi:MAG: acyltransferase [Bacteroidota bacterium]|jgi:surface polysaccharide O-acyltransferase-like enzyme
MELKNKNLDWINSLRVLATFSVIVLHVAARILYQYGSIPNLNWWTGNIYDSSARFCVPIFLMISGTLIFSKTYENTKEYFRKRVLRILFPFMFWSLIYIAVGWFFKFNSGEYLSFKEVLLFVLVNLKSGASFHFWYIYMIIGLYLLFPIIGVWLQNSNKNGIKYFLGIWFLTSLIHLPFIKKLIPNVDISYFSGYIGFPILGYYLSKLSLNFNKKKEIYFSLIVIGIFITIFGTYVSTKYTGNFYSGFYSYLSPNVILVAVGIFLLFKDFVRFNSKFILFFSKYSYGTYLVHVLILTAFGELGISNVFSNPIIGIPIISALCFFVSTLIIWVVNKLPFGKFISG